MLTFLPSLRLHLQNAKTWSLFWIIALLWSPAALAQTGVNQLNPSDIFLKHHTTQKEGTELSKEGKYDEAIAKYGRAHSLLNTLHLNYPEWRSDYVKRAYDRVSKSIQITIDAKQNQKNATSTTLYPNKKDTLSAVDRAKLRARDNFSNDEGMKRLADKISKLQKRLNSKETELNELSYQDASREELLEKIKTKDQQLNDFKSRADLSSENAQARQNVLLEEVAALRAQLESAKAGPGIGQKTDVAQQARVIGALRTEIKKLENDQDSLLISIRKNRLAAKEAQENLEETRAQNKLLQKTVTEKETLYKAKITDLNEEIEILEKSKIIETAAAEIAENNGTPRSKEELASLQKISSQLKKLQSVHKTTLLTQKNELADLKAQQAQHKDTISTLQAKLKTTQDTLQSTQKKDTLRQEELQALNAKLTKANKESEEAKTTLKSVENTVADLKNEITTLTQERSLLLKRPLRSEVDNLKEDLQQIGLEKDTLSKNLSSNEDKYYLALDRIDLLQKELKKAREASTLIEKDLLDERDIANDVIKSQRERLTEQNATLEEKRQQVAKEKEKAVNLQILVDQTKAEYRDLKYKYDDVLTEHNQLRALLSNDNDLDLLKEENLRLQREFRAAQREFKKQLQTTEEDQENLQIARKQYALARAELIKTRHKLELSELKGEKLLGQLQESQNELTIAQDNPDSDYTPEDVRMLKSMIQQQVGLQKNRQKVRNIILEEVTRLGIDDTAFLDALDLADTQELELTREQQELLADKNADEEFRFNDRASPEERERAENTLKQKIQIYNNLGREAYSKKRYAAAEEFFRLNLDSHPGHIPSMLNLGVSQLRKAQFQQDTEAYQESILSFEDAIAMSGDEELPYAYQMLGVVYYQMQDDQNALEHLNKSLAVNPNNAKPHIFLAHIAAEGNDLATAEKHLRTALSIDATLSEPEYNLALLFAEQENYEKALSHYRLALKKGETPDPIFEQRLAQQLSNFTTE